MTRTKLAGKSLFNMPHESTVVDMIREDMGRAKLAWLDTHTDPHERREADAGDFLSTLDSESKRIDFHALRHTCGTWLAQAGVDIKTVQSIMRHSTIVLTMDRYGHLYEGAESDAVGKIRAAFAQPLSHVASQGGAANCAALGVLLGANSYGSVLDNEPLEGQKKTLVSQGISFKNQGFVAMRALGFEPRTQGLKVLCSTD